MLQLARVDAAIVGLVHAVGRADHHHLIALFPGVDHMQHVGGLGLEPADLVGVSVARNHRKTGGHLGMKAQFVAACRQRVIVQQQRKVMQDGVVLGYRHVVGQARAGQRHFNLVLELAVGPDHAVAHVGRLGVVVEEQQFTGVLVGA